MITFFVILVLGSQPLPFVPPQIGIGFVDSIYPLCAAPIMLSAMSIRDFGFPVSLTGVRGRLIAERAITVLVCTMITLVQMLALSLTGQHSFLLLLLYSLVYLSILLIISSLLDTVIASISVGGLMIAVFALSIVPGVAHWIFLDGLAVIGGVALGGYACAVLIYVFMGAEARRRSSGMIVGVTET